MSTPIAIFFDLGDTPVISQFDAPARADVEHAGGGDASIDAAVADPKLGCSRAWIPRF